MQHLSGISLLVIRTCFCLGKGFLFLLFFLNLTHKGTIINFPSFNKKINQKQMNHSKAICKMRKKIILIKQIVRCFTSTIIHIYPITYINRFIFSSKTDFMFLKTNTLISPPKKILTLPMLVKIYSSYKLQM